MSTQPDYLNNPDEGIDETAPVENGEISLFELDSEMGRSHLAQWAESLIPGIDHVELNSRVRVGDLVILRPGSIGFEIYTRSDHSTFERVQSRLRILETVGQQSAKFVGADAEGVLGIAKRWDAWVYGDDNAS